MYRAFEDNPILWIDTWGQQSSVSDPRGAALANECLKAAGDEIGLGVGASAAVGGALNSVPKDCPQKCPPPDLDDCIKKCQKDAEDQKWSRTRLRECVCKCMKTFPPKDKDYNTRSSPPYKKDGGWWSDDGNIWKVDCHAYQQDPHWDVQDPGGNDCRKVYPPGFGRK